MTKHPHARARGRICDGKRRDVSVETETYFRFWSSLKWGFPQRSSAVRETNMGFGCSALRSPICLEDVEGDLCPQH